MSSIYTSDRFRKFLSIKFDIAEVSATVVVSTQVVWSNTVGASCPFSSTQTGAIRTVTPANVLSLGVVTHRTLTFLIIVCY